MHAPVRILHTADWQIGRTFAGIGGDQAALLRHQRLETVRRLAELAAQHAVDVVLVAGDCFDLPEPDPDLTARFCHALAPYPGPWVLLPGNHDAAGSPVWEGLRAHQALPVHCHLATAATPISLAGGRLLILPAPLWGRATASDPTAWFDNAPSPPGCLRVGLAHGAVAGHLPGVASVAIAAGRATSARLDYLALGDWHGTLEISPRTWYAGTPEPDRFKANDAGNCLLVTLSRPGAAPQVERLAVGHYRWREVALCLDEREPAPALDDALGGTLAALGPWDTAPVTAHALVHAPVADPGRYLIRLTLSGTVDLAGQAQLDERLRHWRARLHHLEVRDDALRALPTQAERAALHYPGAAGWVAEALLARLDDPTHPDRAAAGLALQILQQHHLRDGGT
jgi:hypothetical protein